MILYTALRFIRPLCIFINVGKGAGVLSGNFKGAYLLNGFGRNPGNDVKGNGSWRNARNPTSIHWDTATTTAKVL